MAEYCSRVSRSCLLWRNRRLASPLGSSISAQFLGQVPSFRLYPKLSDGTQETFAEANEFTVWIRVYVFDQALADRQRRLLNDPETGSVMRGCAGVRKMRVADPNRGNGKQGGAELVYLQIEGLGQIHLVAVYGNDRKDDLSAADTKSYRRLVEFLKGQSGPIRKR